MIVDSVVEKLYPRVAKYISIRSRSKKEVELYIKRKLPKYFDEKDQGEVISALISKFSQMGALNDEEFAKFWSDSRLYSSKPKGLFIIKQELKLKGIDENIIKSKIADPELMRIEIESAVNFAKKNVKKFINIPEYQAKYKLRLLLQKRGFTSTAVNSVIDEIYQR